MRAQGLWQSQIPSGDALASREPFCIDTLTFPQWLQFIFIVRISLIIQGQEALPQTSGILPMAQEYFGATDWSGAQIMRILRDFDLLILGCNEMSA